MNPVQEMLERYKQVRARLRYPPNAVPDTGINLGGPSTQPKELEEPIPPEPSLEKEKPKPFKEPLLKGLTLSSTLQITAEEFGISVDQIKTKRRHKRIALPRQVALYISTDRHHRGLKWVGHYMNMDHSTVLYARNKIRSLISSDPQFKDRIIESSPTVPCGERCQQQFVY